MSEREAPIVPGTVLLDEIRDINDARLILTALDNAAHHNVGTLR